jgi:type II secretory pathway pseudopilin PulG
MRPIAKRATTIERRTSAGFTYLMAIFIVALMGAGYATVGEMWQTVAAREREAELLHVGNQYRRAIERFYLSGPKRYPRTLEELLKDPRTPTTQRHLRQLYPDPITGKPWALVKAPDGGVMGVYSLSEDVPLKKTNFKLRDRDFGAAKTYADWKFIYTPALQTAPKPAATGPTPSGPQTPATPPAPPPAK